MQEKHRNFYDDFGERIRFIREKRGLTLGQLSGGAASTAKSWESGSLPRPEQWEDIAARLHLSVSLVFLGEAKTKSDYDFVGKYADEIGPPPTVGRLVETAGAYRNSGSLGATPPDTDVSLSSKMLDPRFQPRAEPSLQMCKEYFDEYLRRAAEQPGGIGYAWVKLKKNFPLEDFEPAAPPKKETS